MPDKIKCSYNDCFRHFSTLEAMKKHKAKDAAHDYYCKKCDQDCVDDLELLYHQITSQKHVACPICGREFKSEAGRDRHVEIEHVPKQNIKCVGCGIKFDSASALMGHVERDQCEVIRSEDFQRQKAEKQIVQDAWDAALDPSAGATILSNARNFAPAENEMNLLDDERAFVNTDWQGRPQFDEENEQNGPYVGPPSEQLANLSISRFPPLGPQNQTQPGQPLVSTDSSLHTPQPHQESGPWQPNLAPQGVWGGGSDRVSRLFDRTTSKAPSTITRESTTSINLLDTFTDDDDLPAGSHHPRSHTGTHNRPPHSTSSLAAQASSVIPPAAPPSNPDPASVHAHVQTHRPLRPPTHLQPSSFFDSVLGVYVCPSQHCGSHFSSPQSFTAHVLSSAAHVGGPVTCPGCYKKFKTTTALVAHCESGSRKCRVRDALDFDRVIKQATGGLIAVDGLTDEGGVRYAAQKVENW